MNGWEVIRSLSNGGFGTKFWAIGPGCPKHGHAIRDCQCRPFKNPRDAERYALEQSGTSED